MAFVLFICVLCLCWSATALPNNLTSSHQRPLPYYLLEELPANTLIGNVVVDAKLSEKYSASVMSNLSYHIYKQVNDQGLPVTLFDVDESSGIMKTAVQIDRDEICPKKENCLVYLDITVYPRQYYHLIETVVEILDINDHVPSFAESEIFLQVPESAQPGAVLDLPEAADPDGSSYGIQHYELVSSTSKFELRVKPTKEPTDIKLVIKEKLNYKEANFYQFKLIAYDGGEPPKFGSVLINIKIEDDTDDDLDDNDAKSENSTYEIFVLENTPVGTTIGKVNGRDLNSEDNVTLHYSFSESTDHNYGHLFGIRHNTGVIFLKGTLDYELTSRYVLMVTATYPDSSPLPSHAKVIIQVEDDNDHAPQIVIDTRLASGVATISEKSNIGTFVAKISVNDVDEQNNGKVTCVLDNTGPFQILESGVQEYQILTAMELSRDMPRSQNLKVICHDFGKIQMTSTAEVTVSLSKANHNGPLFTKTTYTATIMENNEIGDTITVVEAADPDDGQNGEIRYRLEADSRDMFSIHPTSGLITTNVVLDHEQTRTIDITVVAFDLGTPVSLSATATVILTVIDVDDEVPQFTQDFFAFGTFENQPPGADVGMVTAKDADGPPFNQFTYHLMEGSSGAVDLFSINSRTGHIYTKVALDREDQPVYYMMAMVRSVTDVTHTSTASVTVYVADRNDNPPAITWPTESNNTVYVSDRLPPNTEIAKIRAFDRDLGSNSKLAYSVEGDISGLFDINLATGILTTKNGVSLSAYDSVDLTVKVADHGFPQLSSTAVLHVIVNSSIPFASNHQAMNVIYTNHNTTIIVSLTSASLLLIFLLIVAIVLIKKQQQEKKAKSYTNNVQPNTMTTGRLESQTMLALRDDTPDGHECCGTEWTSARDQNVFNSAVTKSDSYTEHKNRSLQTPTEEGDISLQIEPSEPNLPNRRQSVKNGPKLIIPDVMQEPEPEKNTKLPKIGSVPSDHQSPHYLLIQSTNNLNAPSQQNSKEVADFCGPESRKPLPDVKNNLNKTKNINVENNNTSN